MIPIIFIYRQVSAGDQDDRNLLLFPCQRSFIHMQSGEVKTTYPSLKMDLNNIKSNMSLQVSKMFDNQT